MKALELRMSNNGLVRILAAVSAATFMCWFLLPQFEYQWLTEDELVILAYA
ncbi:MAG: hypothetical protein WBN09_12855 [Woeseiaceae bacterium]